MNNASGESFITSGKASSGAWELRAHRMNLHVQSGCSRSNLSKFDLPWRKSWIVQDG
jgi:hypothetical protein